MMGASRQRCFDRCGSKLPRLTDALIIRMVVCAALAFLSAAISGCGTMAPLLEPEVGDLQLTIDILQIQNRDAQRALAELRAELDFRNQALANAQIGRAQFEGRVREAERRLAETRRIVELQREELVFARAERERISRNRTRLQTQLNQLKRKMAKSSASVKGQGGDLLVPAGRLHQKGERGMQASLPHPAMPLEREARNIRKTQFRARPAGIVDEGIAEDPDRDFKTGYIVVKPGDTLWSIAQQSGVMIDHLRSFNKLLNDQIEVGQVLWIP